MRLIESGKSVKEISYQLALSIKMVMAYRTLLWKKLKLATIADIIRNAVHEGLVQCAAYTRVAEKRVRK